MTRSNARTLDTARQQPLGAGVTSVPVGQSIYAPPGTVVMLSPQTQQQLASQNLQALAVVNPVTNQATIVVVQNSALSQISQTAVRTTSLSSVYASQAIYNKILTISLASQRSVT
jgi:hypothetical protein